MNILENISRTCEASIWYGEAAQAQEVISTGLPQLDAAARGIPRGRIVEIFGAEDSGKTALALHLAGQIGGPVLYVDADHKLSPHMLNGQDLYLLNVETLENTLQACQEAVVGGFAAIVVDTVAALPTRNEVEDSINNKYGRPEERQAKVLSQCIPQFARTLHATGCTMFLVNQLRNNPRVMYGRPERPTGGNAIKYYAALRLETRRIEIIKAGREITGQKMAVDVVKCKYAPPNKRAYLTLTYGEGIA